MTHPEPTATDLSNDYCGCCGGLSVNPPKGEHGPCCADQHDTGSDQVTDTSDYEAAAAALTYAQLADVHRRSCTIADSHRSNRDTAYDRLLLLDGHTGAPGYAELKAEAEGWEAARAEQSRLTIAISDEIARRIERNDYR